VQTGFPRGTTLIDMRDEQAAVDLQASLGRLIGGQRLDGQPEVFMNHLQLAHRGRHCGGLEALGHRDGIVHPGNHHIIRNREADVLDRRARELGRVDPDEAAVEIDQRAAAVAGIDRRVGLDQVVVGVVLDREAAVQCAENAVADRVLVTRRAAQRNDGFAEKIRRRIAEIEIGELRRLVFNFQQRQVGVLIGGDDLRAVLRAGRERDTDFLFLLRQLHHMRVGQHIAVGGNDQPGADALRRPVCGVAIKLKILVIARDVIGHRFLRRDVHHGRLDIGHDFHDRFIGDVNLAGRRRNFALGRGQPWGLRNRRLGLLGRRRRHLLGLGAVGREAEEENRGKRELANIHNALSFTYDLSRLGIKLRE
jgi:hypothetical protein